MSAYARPATLPEALTLLSARPHVLLAGGTDIYPVAGRIPQGDVLDLTALAGLRGITIVNGEIRIGACTTWDEILCADLPPALAALQQAAVEVGGRQIQNVGTIGGNLCNASPAADGVPPLLAVQAEVELAGTEGLRRLPLGAFLTGPRRTLRREREVMTAVIIPAAGLSGRSKFLKLGARAHLVISIAMVAVRLVIEDARIAEATVAVGACSPVACRLPTVERALTGAAPAEASDRVDASHVLAALSPLDDLRASADYRAMAATVLIRRAVAGAAS
jgi:CO/xanthine dehydrogenase FAD-binding subunit